MQQATAGTSATAPQATADAAARQQLSKKLRQGQVPLS